MPLRDASHVGSAAGLATYSEFSGVFSTVGWAPDFLASGAADCCVAFPHPEIVKASDAPAKLAITRVTSPPFILLITDFIVPVSPGFRALDEFRAEFRFDEGQRWGLGVDPELLETARAACAERHVLEVDYTSVTSGRKAGRRLGPHFLYFAQGALYLVAEDLATSETKVYAMARMHAAQMTDEPFSGTAPSASDFFGGAFGVFRGTAEKIVLDFSPTVSPFISERQWHASQSTERRTDGGVRLSMTCAVSPDLVQWVLGFGPDVTIVASTGLRDQVALRAKAVVAQYGLRSAG